MKTTILLILLAALVCGCNDDTWSRTDSTGERVIETNGAVYLHKWTHIDVYHLLSNNPPFFGGETIIHSNVWFQDVK